MSKSNQLAQYVPEILGTIFVSLLSWYSIYNSSRPSNLMAAVKECEIKSQACRDLKIDLIEVSQYAHSIYLVPWAILLISFLFAIGLVYAKVKIGKEHTVRTGFRHLGSVDEIVSEVRKLLNSPHPNTVQYVGKSYKKIVQILADDVVINNETGVSIVFTGQEDFEDSKLKEILFSKERAAPDEKFSHKFLPYKQYITCIRFGYPARGTVYMFLFSDHSGILIEDKGIEVDWESGMDLGSSMNLLGYSDYVAKEFSAALEQLWYPFVQGYFTPIIPPLKNPDVRKIWQKEILESFNKNGVKFLDDDKLTKAEVTWNIKIGSLEQKNSFKHWLEKLEQKSKDPNVFRVTRYLLIDYEKFSIDSQYKSEVRDILKQLKVLESHAFYNFIYRDTSKLTVDGYKNDIALLSNDVEPKIMQGSNLDTCKDSGIDILKIFFSRSHSKLSQAQHILKQIAEAQNCNLTLDQLLELDENN